MYVGQQLWLTNPPILRCLAFCTCSTYHLPGKSLSGYFQYGAANHQKARKGTKKHQKEPNITCSIRNAYTREGTILNIHVHVHACWQMTMHMHSLTRRLLCPRPSINTGAHSFPSRGLTACC